MAEARHRACRCREQSSPAAVRAHDAAHALPPRQPDGGFVLGLGTGIAYLTLFRGIGLLLKEPLAAAMLLWSFAAVFAVGAAGTGLALLPYE